MPKATRKSCSSPLRAGLGEAHEDIISIRRALVPHPKTLPTNQDILCAVQEKRNKSSQQLPFKDVLEDIVSEVVYIWVDKGGISNVISKKRIRERVIDLFQCWRKAVKSLQGKRNFQGFKSTLDNLFDICQCKFSVSQQMFQDKMVCTCPLEARVPSAMISF